MLQEDRSRVFRVSMPLEAFLGPRQMPIQEFHHVLVHPGTDVPDELTLEVSLQQLGKMRKHFKRHDESKVIAPHGDDVSLAAIHEEHGEHGHRLGTIVLQRMSDIVGPQSTRSPRSIHTLS